jgi:non-heme chloroperoxidase
MLVFVTPKRDEPSESRLTMPTLRTADDTTLFYRSWGDGQPVLFVAAWALSSEMWQYQMRALSEHGFRCVAYDRRGHGRSDDPGRGYDYDTLAADLATVIDALDLQDLVLVGHSMGCGEIIRYLSRYGDDRIKAISLVAPVAPFPLKTDDNPVGLDASLFSAVRESWASDFARWVAEGSDGYVGVGLPGCDVSDALVDWTVRDLLHTSLQAVFEFNRAGVETDFRAELGTIAVPALVIQGDRDLSAPLQITGVRAAHLIPDAVLKVYANAPHGLYLTHSQQLNADLLGFIHAAGKRAVRATGAAS